MSGLPMPSSWKDRFFPKKPVDPWDDWRYPFEFFGLEPDASMVVRLDGGDPFAEPWLDVIWDSLCASMRKLRPRRVD